MVFPSRGCSPLKAKWQLIKVIYDPAKQVELILKMLQLARDEVQAQVSEKSFWPLLAAQLTPWVVMFKDPAFKEEQEWRIVNIDNQPPPSFRFRRSGQRIVPFVTLSLNNPDCITRVMRGPSRRVRQARY